MNKKMKKALFGTLSVAVLSLSAGPALAANDGEETAQVISLPTESHAQANEQISGQEQDDKEVYFQAITGEVTAIDPHGQHDDMQIATLETAEGDPVRIIISDETYTFDDIAIGDEIIAYYDANAPVLMIYPPQFSAKVVAVMEEGRSIKVDYFDENLLSADGSLKLNIAEEADIVSEDGTAYTGSLTDRKLAIRYGMVALSYPAQASPDQIVVLDEDAEEEEPAIEQEDALTDDIIQLPQELERPSLDDLDLTNIESKSWNINGEVVQAPAAYVNDEGVPMVPLRAIAEALGYEVSWNTELASVQVGFMMTMQIGQDRYHYARMSPIELGTAPEITDGQTYVPISFFTEVARVQECYVDGEEIVINQS